MANDQGVGYWLTRRAQLSPDTTALVYEDAAWTYRELDRRATMLAHGLRGLGVNHGDRVGYLDLNHPNFFVTLFATAKLGAIFVPLNFRLTGPELAYIVNDAGIHTLVHDAGFAPLIDAIVPDLCCRHLVRTAAEPTAQGALPAGMRWFDDLLADQRTAPFDMQVGLDEVAWIMYTSGTTGHPKGAMLTHGNLLWNNIQAWIAYDSSTQDRTLVCAPLFHIGGLNVTPMTAFTKGATVVLLRQYDPAAVLAAIARHRITTMFGVPAMFQFMTLVPEWADADLSSLTMLVCGGAPVPEALIRTYAERGVPFVQGYGLTETAPFATIVPLEWMDRKVGSAGIQPFFTDVRLVDDDDREVPLGERGEVVVRGPNVMKGYWNRPEATAEAISNGWFHTGDVGVRDEDGFVTIVDRKKDMIISGGENVYPAEVEAVLYNHPAVAEAAVIGVPDQRWGEAVRAIVVIKPGAALTEAELVAHCHGDLARYKQPRSVVFVDALPRNPAGKVLKYELRERHGGAAPPQPASAETGAPPAGDRMAAQR